MATGIETEMKWLAGTNLEMPTGSDLLALLPDGYGVRPPSQRFLSARYFDTPDLLLARWGCTCRWRNDEGWTVRLPLPSTDAALSLVEVPFDGTAERPPPGAMQLVTPFSLGRELSQVTEVNTERSAVVVEDVTGQPVAELVDDRVVVNHSPGFREIELETQGHQHPNGSLDKLVSYIADRGAVPSSRPKLVQVLGERATEPPPAAVPELGKRPSGRQLVQLAIADSVTRLIMNLPLAILGEDPEGVHQARVATRRLRSDLRTFAPLLNKRAAKSLRIQLKWLADLLGAVRDADVMTGVLAHAAEEAGEPPGAVQLLDRIRAQREAANQHLLDGLDDPRLFRLLQDLVEAAADPPTNKAASRRADKQVGSLLDGPWKQMKRSVKDLPSGAGPQELHRIRVAGKRTRYAAEAMSPVAGKSARRFAKKLARLQDTLGDINDASVAIDWLAATSNGLDSSAQDAAWMMIVGLERDRDELLEKWPAEWSAVRAAQP